MHVDPMARDVPHTEINKSIEDNKAQRLIFTVGSFLRSWGVGYGRYCIKGAS